MCTLFSVPLHLECFEAGKDVKNIREMSGLGSYGER